MALTSGDVAALRTASGVVFQATREGHVIRAILDNGRYTGGPVIYTAREQTAFPETRAYDTGRERTIACDARLTAYADDDVRRASGQFTAFHYEQFAQSSPEWQSIAATIRVGDELTLLWVASNNGEVTNRVGHVRDELRIAFGSGARARTFLVDVQVGPRNTARMVMPGGMP